MYIKDKTFIHWPIEKVFALCCCIHIVFTKLLKKHKHTGLQNVLKRLFSVHTIVYNVGQDMYNFVAMLFHIV